MKKAFLFAGQGAQVPGMACELADPQVLKLFADLESMRPGLRELMEHGSPAQLAETVNTQPCMFAADLAYASDRAAREGEPDAVCGFSVGEVPALVFAGALTVTDGFAVIRKRAALMQAACEKTGGGMIAAVGLTATQADEIAAAIDGVWAANYNAPAQTVLAVRTEQTEALKAAIAAQKGRAIPLKVSGAFHCPLLEQAADEFEDFLRKIPFSSPRIPVYANLTGLPYEGDFAHTLARQMCSPVRFTATVQNMRAAGIGQFDEVGPGKVLTGLVAKQ